MRGTDPLSRRVFSLQTYVDCHHQGSSGSSRARFHPTIVVAPLGAPRGSLPGDRTGSFDAGGYCAGYSSHRDDRRRRGVNSDRVGAAKQSKGRWIVGTVFKKTFTKPLPVGAEIINRKGERFARWKAKGKTRTAVLTTGENGECRLIIESPFYVAKYRDGAGRVQVVSTGCRDETAARQVLADLERRAELIRSNVMTAAEAATGDHQAVPLAKHLGAFDEHHQAKGVTRIHREDTGRYLRRLAADCSFPTLADLRREALERWLALRTVDGMSARTRNAYRNALVSFCNWCV